MNSTNASSSNPSKKIKLTIIPPRQLFINISSDEDITTTPSPTTTSSSPTPPNKPSKTTSTNQTSSSQENTSSSFHSQLQISPPSLHEPTSPHNLNPLFDDILDVPPRPLNPQPLQSHPSLDITLSLTPITPLDHINATPIHQYLPPQPQPPIMVSTAEILDPNLTNIDQTQHEEEDVDDRVRTPSDYEFIDYEKLDDEETMDDEEDDEVINELYGDVNMNLGNEDTEMTYVDQEASEHQNNPSPADNEIASLMETLTRHATAIPEITSGFTTTIPPPPPFFNPLLQQQTPTSTTTTSTYPTVTLPEIPNFASVFKFDQRVSALESEMSEFMQTNQFAESVSLILGIVDMYLASKMKEAVDSTMKVIIKDQVKAQVSKIMPKIEKGRDDQDKDEDPSTGSDLWTKRRKSGKDVESSKDSRSKEKKSSSTSKDALQSQHKSSGKSAHAEEPDLEYLKGGDLSRRYSTLVTKTKAATYELKWIEDLVHELWSPVVVKYDQHAYLGTSHWGPKRQSFYDYASNLTSSKDVYSRRRIIAVTRLKIMKKRVADLQLGVESYQKKLNLTKLDTYRPNLRNKTAYTSYSDPHGIIYMDQYNRKRLMRTDKLHKFSDCMLYDVQTALHNIAVRIRMEYLPMRKWSNLDKKRARVMVQDIDKQLYQRRLMRNLEKFVGGRIYEKDLRLLERTI
ncbi:hypothetical protein Tco_0679019 [Tanacetum coccineum]|uniref:Uncharacterized protein n=1 Tax=Tanacetum coccineum TaxID=301880 RepID=A0ABQ4XGN6_9ASTR